MKSISTLCRLKTLGLNCCVKLTDLSLRLLAHSSCISLRVVLQPVKYYNSVVIYVFYIILSVSSSLTLLSLRACSNLTDKGVSALRTLTLLCHLDMGHNDTLGDRALTKTLPSMTRLEVLLLDRVHSKFLCGCVFLWRVTWYFEYGWCAFINLYIWMVCFYKFIYIIIVFFLWMVVCYFEYVDVQLYIWRCVFTIFFHYNPVHRIDISWPTRDFFSVQSHPSRSYVLPRGSDEGGPNEITAARRTTHESGFESMWSTY